MNFSVNQVKTKEESAAHEEFVRKGYNDKTVVTLSKKNDTTAALLAKEYGIDPQKLIEGRERDKKERSFEENLGRNGERYIAPRSEGFGVGFSKN